MSRTAALISLLFFVHLALGQNERIEQSRNRALEFLLSQQQVNGSFSDSTNPLFNVWETILVCDALETVGTPTALEAFSKARAFLYSSENEQGLICHNSKCREATCVETSAYYLTLCCRAEEGNPGPPFAALSSMQEGEGYWDVRNPDVREITNYPSVTAFVVNLFEACGYMDYNRDKALDFIVKKQLPDGAWGQHWEYYNTPGYALWQCMRALKNEEKYAENYARALEFVLKTQHKDGSWYYEDPAIPNVTSAELQTALMAQCLQSEKDPRAVEALSRALAFLIDQQQANGSFNGGYFPIHNARYKKAEYLLATSLTLIALQKQLKAQKE